MEDTFAHLFPVCKTPLHTYFQCVIFSTPVLDRYNQNPLTCQLLMKKILHLVLLTGNHLISVKIASSCCLHLQDKKVSINCTVFQLSLTYLHSLEANWSILKFAVGNRKLLTLTLSVAFLNRRNQISLLLLSVHVEDVKNAHEMSRVINFERQYQILIMNSYGKLV